MEDHSVLGRSLGKRSRDPPDEQRFMYGRIKAKVTRVAAGHTALVTHPDVVVKVIEEAANATK